MVSPCVGSGVQTGAFRRAGVNGAMLLALGGAASLVIGLAVAAVPREWSRGFHYSAGAPPMFFAFGSRYAIKTESTFGYEMIALMRLANLGEPGLSEPPYLLIGLPPPPTYIEWEAPGWTRFGPDLYPYSELVFESFGWPWPCLMVARAPGYGRFRVLSGFQLTSTGHLWPRRILWTGLAGNSAVFGGVFGAMWLGTVGAHQQLRRRQGRCASCGYSIRGLPTTTCPECGRSFARQPQRAGSAAHGGARD